MKNFAHRCGVEWVIWNRDGWSDAGWISLCLNHVPKRPGEKQRRFRVGWNGQRFASGSELDRLAAFDPGAPDLLRMFLERTVRRPEREAA